MNTYNGYYEQLSLYCSIIIVPTGLTLNTIQFVVFLSKDFKKSNIGFLMNTFVLADSFSLIWNYIVYQYLPLIGYNFQLYSNLSCILFVYVSRIIQQIPLYFQALISFINFLNICYPTRFVKLKKTHIILYFYTIVVFIIMVNLPSAFKSIKIVEENISNSTLTHVKCEASDLMTVIATLDNAIVRCIIPLILIFVLNYFNLKEIVKLRRNLNMSLKREIRFGITLALIGLVFFLFNFPMSCLQILLIIYDYFYKYSLDSNLVELVSFVFECTRSLSISYYAIGIFINISFNKLFRKNLIRLVTCKKK